MAHCGPTYTIPSYESNPVVGLGSAGHGLSCGRFGSLGSGGIIYGSGAGGLSATSAELGTLPGVIPQSINQIPPAEILIQPPSFDVIIPGPILAATGEPVAVEGYSPGTASGSLSGFSGAPGYGMRGTGILGRLGRLGRRGSISRPF